MAEITGVIFDLKRCSTDDGPGIRTTVFLKGCPLHCLWCHNPESFDYGQEIVFYEKRCIFCGSCENICREGVHRLFEGDHSLDRKKCILCGKCCNACPVAALEIKGKTVTVTELFKEIKKDELFFRHTGGGVTFSGGEPTSQPTFLHGVLSSCKEAGIHTALDTSGFVTWEILRNLLDLVDLFLYDLKHMDPREHAKLTGKRNDLIIQNLERILANGKQVDIRVPLIPGQNDGDEHLHQLFSFLTSNQIKRVTLLPFNEAAGSKYSWLGKPFPLAGLESQSPERLAKIVDLGAATGVIVEWPRAV